MEFKVPHIYTNIETIWYVYFPQKKAIYSPGVVEMVVGWDRAIWETASLRFMLTVLMMQLYLLHATSSILLQFVVQYNSTCLFCILLF